MAADKTVPHINDPRSDAQIARDNGWDVGTVVQGHETWPDGLGVTTTWRITGIGEEMVLVKTIKAEYDDGRPDQNREGPEHSATFKFRNWTKVIADAEPR